MNIDEAVDLASKHELWWRGAPGDYLLDDGQLQWRELWKRHKSIVGKVARRRGKSFFAVVASVEDCLQNKGMFVDYLAQTGGSAQGIVKPILDTILEDCPKEIRPVFHPQDAMWEFKSTGSQLFVSGVDNGQFRRRRGRTSHRVVYDEFGFYLDPEEAEAVFNPQLFTTGGKSLYISSPPENPTHPFVARFNDASAMGRAFGGTIFDNPRLSKEQIREFLIEQAGIRGMTLDEFMQSTYCRREFLAEVVTEESRAAIPGYTLERSKDIVREWPRPEYRDHYVSLDLGYSDGHGVLFAYWDFKASMLIVEDELVLRGKTTDDLCAAIKLKEKELYGVDKYDGTLAGVKDWGDLPDYVRRYAQMKTQPQPYLRISDNDPLVLADIIQRHGIAFLPTRKDDKAAAVDDLDIAVRNCRIAVHPRCRNLHKQLLSTLWNKQRTEWERTSDGHGELVDALIYLWRNVRKHKNPEPQQRRDTFQEYVDRMNGKPGVALEFSKLGRIGR